MKQIGTTYYAGTKRSGVYYIFPSIHFPFPIVWPCIIFLTLYIITYLLRDTYSKHEWVIGWDGMWSPCKVIQLSSTKDVNKEAALPADSQTSSDRCLLWLSVAVTWQGVRVSPSFQRAAFEGMFVYLSAALGSFLFRVGAEASQSYQLLGGLAGNNPVPACFLHKKWMPLCSRQQAQCFTMSFCTLFLSFFFLASSYPPWACETYFCSVYFPFFIT